MVVCTIVNMATVYTVVVNINMTFAYRSNVNSVAIIY